VVRGRVGQRVGGHVLRVAIGLGAVPQQLDEREDERTLEL
jgi:hypothetical protein